MRRSVLTILLVLAAAALLSACRPETTETPTVAVFTATPTQTREATPTPFAAATDTEVPSETPTPTVEPTPTPAAFGPDNFPAFVNPLTGMVVTDTRILDRAPVMVKVSNFPRGLRPHSGLSFADLVFEYYIGVGATRFTALFYGRDVEQVGPMRSARMIDADLGNAFQGVLAFISADPFVLNHVLNALGERAITEASQTCPAICRTGTGDVNSVFGNTEEITAFAREEHNVSLDRPNLDGIAFDPDAQPGGGPGDWVEVAYSAFARSQWRYDPTGGKYLRWIESVDANSNLTMVELTDRLTDEQLAFSNVVVMFAFHNEIKPTLHEIVLLGNTTGQRALIFRDGQVYDVTWKATASDRPFQFFTPDGEIFPLKPGNTWVEVVGLNSSVTEPEAGQWQVQFFLP